MINKFYEIKEYILYRKYLIVGLLILIIILGFYFYNKNNNEELVEEPKQVLEKEKEEIVENIDKCVVDIKGSVINSGMYEADCDARVNDIINLAGGLKDNADTSVNNLAKKISDGMVIVIYSKDELEDFTKTKEKELVIEDKCINNTIKNDSCVTKESRLEESITVIVDENPSKEIKKDNKLISINTASKDELMTLSGIGESKALAIISYRENNGLFERIEDIMNVSGIGEKMFEKIKDFITL